MSAPRFAKPASALRAAVLEAAWTQWQAFGAQAAAARLPSAMVDPEALVLASLWLRDDEPRLWDFLHGLAGAAPRLLSVQRVQRLLAAFPNDGPSRLALFARAVADQGKDPRWRRLASRTQPPKARPRKLELPLERLGMPAGLMMRLRTGMGVDARTDTLAYLLARDGHWASVADIAAELSYAVSTVRAATDALAAARMIESSETHPRRFYANRRRWNAVLGEAGFAPWQPWAQAFPFALRLSQWFAAEGARASSDDLAVSLARDLIEQHGSVLAALQLDVPDHRAFTGQAAAPAFERTIVALSEWFRGRV
jgi:hypothetical protein